MQSLNRLLVLFLEISLLRKGPQDVPSSAFLVLSTAVLGLLSGVVVLSDSFAGPGGALGAQLLDLVLLTTFVYIGLQITGRLGRLYQALAAFFGCGVLINIATLLAIALSGPVEEGALTGVGAMLHVFIMIWALVVIAHILRHTFEIAFMGGVALAVAYFLLVNSLVQQLFVVN